MAKAKKKKALTGAQRMARVKVRYKNAGLREIKIMVAGFDTDPKGEEARAVRNYAAKKPKTKAILQSLAT